MNKIEQLKLVRRALVKMLKVLEPMQGKNLNRNKKFTDYDDLLEEWETTPPPFEFNGILSGWFVNDRQNVDITRLKEKVEELENVLHELDLFDNGDAEEYKTIQEEIKLLAEKQRQLKIKYSHIPSYFLDDFVKDI